MIAGDARREMLLCVWIGNVYTALSLPGIIDLINMLTRSNPMRGGKTEAQKHREETKTIFLKFAPLNSKAISAQIISEPN